jgi:hypothetical protein
LGAAVELRSNGNYCSHHSKQHKALLELKQSKSINDVSPNANYWATEYCKQIQIAPNSADTALDILMSRTHGPHSTAWWVNAIQLKLGLLGKVIGFSILALNIGQLQSFDPTQSQELLKSLTLGLGVALLTTMVGLVGNILLGLQITRLDRYADDLVEQAQSYGLHLLSQSQTT